jgi:hypothetical protein
MKNRELAAASAFQSPQGDTVLDLRVWRWYSAAVTSGRVTCYWNERTWVVNLNGREIAEDVSFQHALKSAEVMDRALSALQRR